MKVEFFVNRFFATSGVLTLCARDETLLCIQRDLSEMAVIHQIPKETGREATINLRATKKQKAWIDQAADALGRSRSDFMLDAVCREAESVLLDRRYFSLSDEAYRKFTAVLDAPPKENRRLRRLLETKALWER